MTLTDRIEELARLYEAATPGEWVVGVSIDYAYDWPVFRLREMADSNDEAEIAADRKLIEQFHNDFPVLLPVLRAAVAYAKYREAMSLERLVAAVEEATRE